MLLSKNEKRFLMLGFVVLLIGASFVDLPLTKALYDPSSPFGLFFKHFASFPGMGLGALSFCVLAVTDPLNKNLRILNRIVNSVLMLVFGFSLVYTPVVSMGIHQPLIGLFGIAFVLIAAYLIAKLPVVRKQSLRKYAMIGAITMVGSMAAVNLLKIVWGRARYWTFVGNDTLFSPWYLPRGFTLSESFKSFPSGHSQFAAVSLISTMLPDVFDSLKGKQRSFLLGSIAWIIMVMLSRMMLGEHFLSDTLVGVAITVCIFAETKKYILKL